MCRWKRNAPWWTTTRPRWAWSNSSAALRRPDLKSQTEAKKCAHHSHPAVVQPNKSALLKRLNRIEGQARGVAKMVEEDRYCIDILTQIAGCRVREAKFPPPRILSGTIVVLGRPLHLPGCHSVKT